MESRFGLMLKQAGENVILVDGWQDHIDAVRNKGLISNLYGKEVQEFIPIYHQYEVSDSNIQDDLVILFTKAMQLDHIFHSL